MSKTKRSITKALAALCVLTLTLCAAACKPQGILTEKEDLLHGYEKASSVVNYDFISEDATPPEKYESYTQSITELSLSVLTNTQTSGENNVTSSLSLAHTLSLLLNGASANTASQIKNLIGTGLDQSALNQCSYYLNSRLTTFNTDTEGYFEESSLWLNDSFSVKSSYLQTVKNFYTAHIVRKILSDSDTADKINKIASESTKGEIANILSEPLSDTTIFALSCAVLKDSWVTPYTSDRIKDGTFHGAKGDETASFMTSNERYISSDFAEGFVKSLKNTPVKFAAIMPKDGKSVEELLSTLSYNRLNTLLLESNATDFCSATIPELYLESQGYIDSTLKALGVESAYNEEKANFTGLTDSQKITLTSFMSSTKIGISPQGTEKTDSISDPTTDYTPAERQLVFDKPFIFVFFDNESGAPIFMGTVNNIEN